MGPTFNLKKKEKQKQNQSSSISFTEKSRRLVEFFFFKFLSFKTSLFDSRVSDLRISSGQTRQVLYAWEPKTWDFTENSGKNSEKS